MLAVIQCRTTNAILLPFVLTAIRVMPFKPAREKSAISLQSLSFNGTIANNFESLAINSRPEGIQA